MKWRIMELIGDILVICLAIVAASLIGMLAVVIFNNIPLWYDSYTKAMFLKHGTAIGNNLHKEI